MLILFGQGSYSIKSHLVVGKIWKSLVTIFNFGICHSAFLALSFFSFNGLSLKFEFH